MLYEKQLKKNPIFLNNSLNPANRDINNPHDLIIENESIYKSNSEVYSSLNYDLKYS